MHVKETTFNDMDTSAGKEPKDFSVGESAASANVTSSELLGSDSEVNEANERSESRFTHRVHVIDGLDSHVNAFN